MDDSAHQPRPVKADASGEQQVGNTVHAMSPTRGPSIRRGPDAVLSESPGERTTIGFSPIETARGTPPPAARTTAAGPLGNRQSRRARRSPGFQSAAIYSLRPQAWETIPARETGRPARSGAASAR